MRYGFFSDVHANIEALEAVAEDFQAQKLDQTMFLGDAVGYGASPNECLKLIHRLASRSLMGNHDYAALGLMEADYFNQYARESIEWTKTILENGSHEIMANFYLTYKFDILHLVHATPREPEAWHYILNLSEAEENFGYFTKRVCLIGHSHRPVIIKKFEDRHCFIHNETQATLEDEFRYLINIGSVGQPRDGNPDACYLIYDTDAKVMQLRRVPYDVKKAQKKMKKAGLSQYLAERLSVGR